MGTETELQSMDEILSDKEPEIQVVDVKTDETKDESTGEEASEATKAAKAAEDAEKAKDASPASEIETKVPISAMHGERDRRQAAEKERDELKAQLDESNKVEPTSVFVDEEKFRQEIASELNQKLTNASLNQSEFFAGREFGKDVLEQKIEKFKTLIETNPDLKQRFVNAISPYHELVDIVDKHDELAKMDDLDAYKAKLKAEAKAEVKAELEKEAKDKTELRDSVPDSLVGDASVGGLESTDAEPLASAKDVYG